jgi:AraC-like DNA-binding protein
MEAMQDKGKQRRPVEATVRVGGAMAITALLMEMGIDPSGVLKEAGIDPRLFSDPDNLITYRARGRLMARAVAKTGCQHFGLLVGQRMNLQSLGLVGMLARHSPDVGTALRSIVNFLHLHARGAVMRLSVQDTLVMLTYDPYQLNTEATDQIGDGAVAMMLNVIRTLCRSTFQPIEARFAHRKPDDVRPFRQFFRAPLRFDAESYALVFSHEWLTQPVPGTDAELNRLLQKQIDAVEARYVDDFPEAVRGVLRSALLTGHATEDQIAALFSMHSRTLGRRLEGFGTSFHELLEEGRFEIARQMLKDTSLGIADIADSIGYSRASSLTRAFQRWSGTTPARWRARQARLGQDLPGSAHPGRASRGRRHRT